jgi:hypothetical protein
MTLFVNYSQILADAVALVRASSLFDASNPTLFREVLKNANDRDYVTENMPLLDFRFKRAVPQDKATDSYWVEGLIEAEVAVFDLTSLDDAATIRDNLASGLQRLFQTNLRFSGSLDTTVVGNAEFGTGESKQTGAFVAGAVLDFHVFLYVDR